MTPPISVAFLALYFLIHHFLLFLFLPFYLMSVWISGTGSLFKDRQI